ncbi:MAG: tRNA (adenosine(37)-N6)-threonylcarbamoyltransferase complex ATPase subunit type 1 TsaE [Saccharofermentanales bacterium]
MLANDRSIKVITMNREETVSIGAILGKGLKPGDIVCLDGDLGAGKTAFTSGIASGMGVTGIIASPTFTILIEHTKTDNLPLYHFDAYRIENEQDFYDLGFDEYFSYGGVCVIEWADKIIAAVPQNAIHVKMRQGSEEVTDRRELEFHFGDDEERADLFLQKLTEAGFDAFNDYPKE